MRTTLNLDDDLVTAARALARADGRPLGAVISQLARRGLVAPSIDQCADDDGFPAFSVPAGSPPITADTVEKALGEQ